MKPKVYSILTAILVVILTVIMVSVIPKLMTQKTFEAVVREKIITPNGEARLIVERTTDIYSDPINSLCIGSETNLIGKSGDEISLDEINIGDRVKVNLKNAFTEESPFYYPIVYKVRIIE